MGWGLRVRAGLGGKVWVAVRGWAKGLHLGARCRVREHVVAHGVRDLIGVRVRIRARARGLGLVSGSVRVGVSIRLS